MNFDNITANLKIDTTQMPTYQTIFGDWSLNDYWGNIKVRLAFGRYKYIVNPGIYAIGNPTRDSDVIVTSNYKLTFDIVRKELNGLNIWILILDTKGINVWCAAGKGTFGTDELMNRIKSTKLSLLINHKRIILPQLGAVGVAAHVVTKNTGFKIIYGPVLAADIKQFIANNYQATTEMRTVRFNMKDRIVLTPVEISMSFKYLFIAIVAFFVISGIHGKSYSITESLQDGLITTKLLIAAYISGTFLTPMFLPYIPSRAFAVKGLIMGLMVLGLFLVNHFYSFTLLPILSWIFIFSSVSSFLAMNFTGASTYTSITGVEKEMKIALPLQIASAAIGFILFFVSQFIN